LIRFFFLGLHHPNHPSPAIILSSPVPFWVFYGWYLSLFPLHHVRCFGLRSTQESLIYDTLAVLQVLYDSEQWACMNSFFSNPFCAQVNTFLFTLFYSFNSICASINHRFLL
jgi:hypothetical protein